MVRTESACAERLACGEPLMVATKLMCTVAADTVKSISEVIVDHNRGRSTKWASH
eukprot:SAG25_NODE_2803_length_1377_cov_1.924883_3_plen_54_part_01